jgi:hypothetical protein
LLEQIGPTWLIVAPRATVNESVADATTGRMDIVGRKVALMPTVIGVQAFTAAVSGGIEVLNVITNPTSRLIPFLEDRKKVIYIQFCICNKLGCRGSHSDPRTFFRCPNTIAKH